MKKIYYSVIATFLVIAQSSSGQPTLTAANTTPVIGDNFTYHSGNPANPVPITNGGAAQSWSIASYVATQTTSGNFIAPASTPYASFFPSATISVYDGSGGSYEYYFTSSSEYSYLGYYSSSNSLIYVNSWKQMSYPFTYGNSYTDNFSDGGMGIYGTTTGTADGYGSIALPYGTFSNLLRTHFHTLYIDSTFGTSDTLVEDYYYWFKTGTHSPLVAYLEINSSGFSYYALQYLDQSSVGIENAPGNANVFSVYPNPAHDVIYVNAGKDLKISKIELVNTLGQIIKELIPEQSVISNSKLDVADLPRGFYLLNIWEEGKKVCKKIRIE